jgi:hypothetical protein
VLGYTPLVAGVAIVPAAVAMVLGAGAGAHLTAMHGARITVTAGTLFAAAGIAVQAAFADGGSYLPTGIGLFLFGLAAGVVMPAATEVIMASVPPSRAGVGSAVNDTVREFGGALGVAVIGSVAATSYSSSMSRDLARFPGLTDTDRGLIRNNVGAALEVSHRVGGATGDQIASAARSAFVDSMHSSLWIAAALAFSAAVVACTHMPRRQQGDTAHAHASHGGHHVPVHTAERDRAEVLV